MLQQSIGNPSRLNPKLPLNQQTDLLPHNPKYKIDRSEFEVGKMLGSGNFGSVYEGIAKGLLHPGSKAKVAIKTVHDPSDHKQSYTLNCEIKVMANLDHHPNLVNMVGSCTSQIDDGKIWLLLEFCSHGDLKSFLIQHRKEFIESTKKNQPVNGFQEKLLMQWCHDIAKGMEYLSSKHVMHGDLAARNILLSNRKDGSNNYVAKVADFGLSKNFYYAQVYQKEERPEVPWKWMALEYLMDGVLTMKSDVWSYGILLWEIFSLGQVPYMHQIESTRETIDDIKKGYQLPFPDTLTDASHKRQSKVVYALEDFYLDITDGCWEADPTERFSFTNLLEIIENCRLF